MAEAIFLSASVPDPTRAPEHARTANTVAITSAVSALVHVTLGRRLLIWGGHPAITPMICQVAESLNVDYGRWVKLYQSRHFKDEYPEDNARFQNVRYTDDVGGDREKSLLEMRTRMFTEHAFGAGVFIGGMKGIIDEFELFRRHQPDARLVPVFSTGGAVLELKNQLPAAAAELGDDLDYVGLFHRQLGISVREQRYTRPEDQPSVPEQRLWRPPAR